MVDAFQEKERIFALCVDIRRESLACCILFALAWILWLSCLPFRIKWECQCLTVVAWVLEELLCCLTSHIDEFEMSQVLLDQCLLLWGSLCTTPSVNSLSSCLSSLFPSHALTHGEYFGVSWRGRASYHSTTICVLLSSQFGVLFRYMHSPYSARVQALKLLDGVAFKNWHRQGHFLGSSVASTVLYWMRWRIFSNRCLDITWDQRVK